MCTLRVLQWALFIEVKVSDPCCVKSALYSVILTYQNPDMGILSVYIKVLIVAEQKKCSNNRAFSSQNKTVKEIKIVGAVVKCNRIDLHYEDLNLSSHFDTCF